MLRHAVLLLSTPVAAFETSSLRLVQDLMLTLSTNYGRHSTAIQIFWQNSGVCQVDLANVGQLKLAIKLWLKDSTLL